MNLSLITDFYSNHTDGKEKRKKERRGHQSSAFNSTKTPPPLPTHEIEELTGRTSGAAVPILTPELLWFLKQSLASSALLRTTIHDPIGSKSAFLRQKTNDHHHAKSS